MMSFLLRFSLTFCWTAVSFPTFLRFPHTLFVKGNCTVISHSVGYSVVKEHFGSDYLDLFSCSYSLAELFALYIGLLKNHRKINPHSKNFSWSTFQPQLIKRQKIICVEPNIFRTFKKRHKKSLPRRSTRGIIQNIKFITKQSHPSNGWLCARAV